jgi:hypothetical protein
LSLRRPRQPHCFVLSEPPSRFLDSICMCIRPHSASESHSALCSSAHLFFSALPACQTDLPNRFGTRAPPLLTRSLGRCRTQAGSSPTSRPDKDSADPQSRSVELSAPRLCLRQPRPAPGDTSRAAAERTGSINPGNDGAC